MNELDALKALNDLRAQIATTQRRLAAMRKLVDGYVELFPHLAEAVAPRATGGAATSTQPKGQDAVRRVLVDDPGREYTVNMMVERLSALDWLPPIDQPANAVRAALNRLSGTDPEHFRKIRVGGAVNYAYVESREAVHDERVPDGDGS